MVNQHEPATTEVACPGQSDRQRKPTATAASTALPPASRISAPTADDRWFCEATMPAGPNVRMHPGVIPDDRGFRGLGRAWVEISVAQIATSIERIGFP